MPTYTFLNNETKEEFNITLKISEYEEYKLANPHMTQLLSPTPLADPTHVGVTTKPESGFRDLLKDIHKKHRHSVINTF